MRGEVHDTSDANISTREEGSGAESSQAELRGVERINRDRAEREREGYYTSFNHDNRSRNDKASSVQFRRCSASLSFALILRASSSIESIPRSFKATCYQPLLVFQLPVDGEEEDGRTYIQTSPVFREELVAVFRGGVAAQILYSRTLG